MLFKTLVDRFKLMTHTTTYTSPKVVITTFEVFRREISTIKKKIQNKNALRILPIEGLGKVILENVECGLLHSQCVCPDVLG